MQLQSFTHIELATQDPAAAKEFYAAIFPDWKYEEMPSPAGPYTMIKPANGGTGGAIFQHPMKGAPSFWCPYVSVKDCTATTEAAKKAGAKVFRENCDVGPGWISIFSDPTGATFGIFQSR